MPNIQQMFHCFIVREDNRNFLKFRWYHNNNVSNEIIHYRIRVHVFSNRPSPTVAIYGLRKTAHDSEKEFGSDARKFMKNYFYINVLKLLSTKEEYAIDLLKRTQDMLALPTSGFKKINSNSRQGNKILSF